MDLLDQALETSQDKDGECSPTSSEAAAMVAAETCLVVEGGREVLAMVDDDDGGRVGSDEEEDEPAALHRSQHVVVHSSGRRRQRRGGVMLHQSASSSVDDTSIMDQEQFEFRADNGGGGPPGTVTYRVVQVAPSSAGGNNSNDEMESMPQIINTAGNFSAPAGTTGSGVQAVLTSPLNGQFYVIGSPQEVFSGAQRNIAPRSNLADAVGRSASRRDERRRATHNEVERRRRDKINNWIMKLGKIIPDCGPDQAKQGQVSFEGQSKGGILAKACEYIVELRTANQRMGECMKENERLAMQIESLRQQNEELRRESSSFRNQLQQNGIAPMSSSASSPQRNRDTLTS